MNIIEKCQRLGIGEGGFYQPSFGGRRKMHLWMMCLGKDWDAQTKLYGEIRHLDNTVPPSIPAEFIPLVYGAIHTAHEALRINLGSTTFKADSETMDVSQNSLHKNAQMVGRNHMVETQQPLDYQINGCDSFCFGFSPTLTVK